MFIKIINTEIKSRIYLTDFHDCWGLFWKWLFQVSKTTYYKFINYVLFYSSLFWRNASDRCEKSFKLFWKLFLFMNLLESNLPPRKNARHKISVFTKCIKSCPTLNIAAATSYKVFFKKWLTQAVKTHFQKSTTDQILHIVGICHHIHRISSQDPKLFQFSNLQSHLKF